MKFTLNVFFLSAWSALSLAQAQPPTLRKVFQHVVVIFQENRTPDNMFQGLCSPPYGTTTSCSTTPGPGQYDIQTTNWLDKPAPGGTIMPLTVSLSGSYGLGHSHHDFTTMCDLNPATGQCAMDGAAGISCAYCNGTTQPQFRYVDNSSGILNPYLTLASQYGWANYMFQTNQGPSFPAHQYIFGGTSAPNADDDHIGLFAAENSLPAAGFTGCTALPGTYAYLIDANGVEGATSPVYPCFEHQTLADLLDEQKVTWRYYAANANGIWTAPNAISHICAPVNGSCQGADWLANVDLMSADVLRDVGKCNLRDVSWVTPTGQNSDHALLNDGGGPSWVASVVNAIGSSSCKNPDGTSYWDTTAIIIAWDDWGGWYDHVPPPFLPYPEGGYQFGFRVPMIVVSPFTRAGYISNKRYDFGSIVRFIENNFGLAEGALTFADARATTDLHEFFTFTTQPRVFRTIAAPRKASFFLKDKRKQLDPDDD